MPSKLDIWMPLYIGDYLAATTHLSAEESGAYMHLLMHQWKNGTLPADLEALRRIARVERDAWSNAWAVLKPFFDFATGAPQQLRLEQIRIEWAAKKDKSEAKARKAADAMWAKRRGDAPSTAQAMPQSCPSSSSSPSTVVKTKTIARAEPSDDELQVLYSAYPRKIGAMKAKAAIRKAVEHLGSGKDMPAMSPADALSFLMGRVSRFAKTPAGNAGEYTPHPATWFNQARYLDDEDEWMRTGQESNGGKYGNNQQHRRQPVSNAVRRVDEAVEQLRKAGVEITDGPPEGSPAEVCAPAWRGHGRGTPGIILEGARQVP